MPPRLYLNGSYAPTAPSILATEFTKSENDARPPSIDRAHPN
jgi:hypothetical protein